MYFNKRLTDKELLADLLNSEKQISNEYNNAILESSCPILRKIFSSCLLNTLDTHCTILNTLEKRDLNNSTPVHQKDIDILIGQFKSII